MTDWKTNRRTGKKLRLVKETEFIDGVEQIVRYRDPSSGRFAKKPSGRPENESQ